MITTFLILAISVIFIPVSPQFIDILLIFNLSISLLMILLVLNTKDTLKLSTLPTLLLITTFFRLCTNISTTRCILTNGSAGKLINIFGEVTIQHSLLVGLTIFLIITVVQFVVIAKGGERIAEVTARFSLDALPGKQMAIDADLRAGVIDSDQARVKREELQMESRFYGSLDGAMKFIKGDAVVFIFISLINLIMGFFLSISKGFSLTESVSKSSILTIGDGLFAQGLSLLCSLAAVMLVTRSSRESLSSLSQEVSQQLFQNKQITLYVFLIGFVVCFVTNPLYLLITLPFLLFYIFSAYRRKNKLHSSNSSVVTNNSYFHNETIKIFIDCSAIKFDLSHMPQKILREVFSCTGVMLPNILFLNQDPKVKDILTIYYRDNLIVKKHINEQLLLNQDDLFQELLSSLNEEIIVFVNDSMTKRLIDFYEGEYNDLINTVVPNISSITQTTQMLKDLVEEKVSIKDFPTILQAIAEFAPKYGSSRQLYEEVRIALKITIVNSVKSEFDLKDNTLDVIRIDASADLFLTQCEREGKLPDGTFLKHVTDFFSRISPSLIVVCSRGSRKLLSEILESLDFNNKVFAFEELKKITFNVTDRLEFNK